MNEQTTPENEPSTEAEATKPQTAEAPEAIDPLDLVYTSSYSTARGSVSEDPRELLSNPAVAPQTLDSSVESLRDDMIRDVEDH